MLFDGFRAATCQDFTPNCFSSGKKRTVRLLKISYRKTRLWKCRQKLVNTYTIIRIAFTSNISENPPVCIQIEVCKYTIILKISFFRNTCKNPPVWVQKYSVMSSNYCVFDQLQKIWHPPSRNLRHIKFLLQNILNSPWNMLIALTIGLIESPVTHQHVFLGGSRWTYKTWASSRLLWGK